MKRIAIVTIMLVAALPAAAQQVYHIDEVAAGEPETAPVGPFEHAVVLKDGASIDLAVPIEPGLCHVSITARAVGEMEATLATLVEGETGMRHRVPADVWGRVGLGVASDLAGEAADVTLTARGGAVALGQVAAERLEVSHETLPLVSPGVIHRETRLIADGEAAATLILPRMAEYTGRWRRSSRPAFGS